MNGISERSTISLLLECAILCLEVLFLYVKAGMVLLGVFVVEIWQFFEFVNGFIMKLCRGIVDVTRNRHSKSRTQKIREENVIESEIYVQSMLYYDSKTPPRCYNAMS